MSDMTELQEKILKLDDERLRGVIDFSIGEYKRRLSFRRREKALLLVTARRVHFLGRNSSRLPHGAEGTVLKVNQRSVCGFRPVRESMAG